MISNSNNMRLLAHQSAGQTLSRFICVVLRAVVLLVEILYRTNPKLTPDGQERIASANEVFTAPPIRTINVHRCHHAYTRDRDIDHVQIWLRQKIRTNCLHPAKDERVPHLEYRSAEGGNGLDWWRTRWYVENDVIKSLRSLYTLHISSCIGKWVTADDVIGFVRHPQPYFRESLRLCSGSDR
jgi:hypothetical protein